MRKINPNRTISHINLIWSIILFTGLFTESHAQGFSAALMGGTGVNFQTKHDLNNRSSTNLYARFESMNMELSYTLPQLNTADIVLSGSFSWHKQLSSLRSDPFVSYHEPAHEIKVGFSGVGLGIGMRFQILEYQRLKLTMGAHFNVIILDAGPIGDDTVANNYSFKNGNGRIDTVHYEIHKNYFEGYSYGPKFDINAEYALSKRFKVLFNSGFYLGVNNVYNTLFVYQIKFQSKGPSVVGDNVTINKLSNINFNLGLKYKFGD